MIDKFYGYLEKTVIKTSSKNIIILIRGINAKLLSGSLKKVMGNNGLIS